MFIVRKFSIIKNVFKDRIINGKGWRPKGLLDWFYILRNISDEDLKVISGTDGALYLLF